MKKNKLVQIGSISRTQLTWVKEKILLTGILSFSLHKKASTLWLLKVRFVWLKVKEFDYHVNVDGIY